MPPTKKQTAKKKAGPQRPTSQTTAGAKVVEAAALPTGYEPTTWGAPSGNILDGIAEDITVPSGQRCLARRPGIQGLVAAGVLDHVDSLTQLVGAKVVNRAKGMQVEEPDLKKLAQDPDKLIEVLEVVDKIVCHVVLKPPITPSPKCNICGKVIEWHQWAPTSEVGHVPVFDVVDGAIYAFQVDIDDKMFLVNFAVGGTRSLERFRDESTELVERMEPE